MVDQTEIAEPSACAPSPSSDVAVYAAIFDRFVKNNNDNAPKTGVGSRRQLSVSTIRLYGLFWKSYCEYLLSQRDGRLWHQASPEDVGQFLDSVSPRSKRDLTAKASSVTRDRYQTVIDRVYTFACTQNIENLFQSPVRITRLPASTPRESAKSFLMHRSYRTKLLRMIDTQASGWGARDAAMLALMSKQGLTSSEVMLLKCSDLEWDGEACPNIEWIDTEGMWNTQRFGELPTPLAIHIQAISRDSQSRRLQLDELSQKTLRQWISQRGTMMPSKDRDLLLFGIDGQLSSVSVFKIARKHILGVLGSTDGNESEYQDMVHSGPMTLRTAALMQWMEDIEDINEVLRRAGLKEPKSLQRIAGHTSGEVKQRYDAAVKDYAITMAMMHETKETTQPIAADTINPA